MSQDIHHEETAALISSRLEAAQSEYNVGGHDEGLHFGAISVQSSHIASQENPPNQPSIAYQPSSSSPPRGSPHHGTSLASIHVCPGSKVAPNPDLMVPHLPGPPDVGNEITSHHRRLNTASVQDRLSLSDTPQAISQCTEFWEKYNNIADAEDKGFVKAAGGELDVLLIFAGLFSGVNTAFIIEAYKGLKPDHEEETTKLLRSIFMGLHNSSLVIDPVNTQMFSPPGYDIAINAFFFLSLCCSLSAAFGAVVVKQWLTLYDQEGGGSLKPPSARGQERQRKYNGRGKWHLEDVIATLPTLLQLSLFFFLVGLTMFIWPLNHYIASVIIAFSVLTFSFFAATISISIIDPSSPFQTRFSALIQSTWLRYRGLAAPVVAIASLLFSAIGLCTLLKIHSLVGWAFVVLAWLGLGVMCYLLHTVGATRKLSIPLKALFSSQALLKVTTYIRKRHQSSVYARLRKSTILRTEANADDPLQYARCIAYIMERVTTSEDLYMLANAMRSMVDNTGAEIIAEALITFHLKPMRCSGRWVFLGLSGASRKPLLKILHILLVDWAYYESALAYTHLCSPEEYLTPLRISSLAYRLVGAVCDGLWGAFLADPKDQETFDLIHSISVIRPPYDYYPSPPTSGSLDWEIVDKVLRDDSDDLAQQRCLALLNATSDIVAPAEIMALSVRQSWCRSSGPQILCSKMWMDISKRQPALDGVWTACLRMQALPAVLLDELPDFYFAEYLALSFTHYAIPDPLYTARDSRSARRYKLDQPGQQSLHWSYALAVHNLLKGQDNQLWSRELVRHGHLACLRVVLGDSATAAGSVLALYSFLCLWARGAGDGESDEVLGAYMSSDWVEIVVATVTERTLDIDNIMFAMNRGGRIFMPGNGDYSWKPRLLEDTDEMVEWLCSYLERAVLAGLVHEDKVPGVLRGYKQWNEALDKSELQRDHRVCQARVSRLIDATRNISDTIRYSRTSEL